MTETQRTNRYALFFFLYFMGTSVAVALLPFFGTMSNSGRMLAAQLICFLPALAFYFYYTKKDIRKTLRLHPLGWKNALLILFFGVSIQPLISLLSYLTSLFFPNPVEQSIESIQQSGFFISLLSVAVLPAILEEMFSRGILLTGYRFLGKWKAALVSALLFGLLHMNPQQFLYAFLIGFIFCFLVDRTDSLYASILPHMVINGTTLVSIFTEGAGTGPVELESSVILASLLLMAILSIPWLALLLYLFLRLNPTKVEPELVDEAGNPYRERFLTPSMVGIFILYILCGIIPYLSS
ncbi:MAG: CPBP family intramembrane metalloprotease [Anaerotignum sp.]|nr:CPBP family intramembrane metalloprotease [Anaerotignum sp.]